jgi:NADH:ubiquinone oxidoreductase subunit 3 (subunit A)
MGSFEIFHYWTLVNILIALIIVILSFFSFKNILTRFGLLKITRRGFYECGFKPLIQKPIQISMQFIIISIFFILYDIELVFSFPLVSAFINHTFLEFIIFIIIYGSFIVSLIFDFDRYLTNWKF